MKKIFYYMLLLFALAACQDTLEEQIIPQRNSAKPEFTASVETSDSETKTTLDGGNNILWNLEDKVNIFLKKTTPSLYNVQKGTEGKTSCTFVKEEGTAGRSAVSATSIAHNVAIYPACKGTLQAEGGDYVYEMTLPRERAYGSVTQTSFSNMTMVAVSTNNSLSFKNCYGAVKLQLTGTEKIAKITLEGKNKEFLSGKHKIHFGESNLPTVEATGEYQRDWFDKTSILVDNVQLSDSPTTFYIIVPPADFAQGFKVIVTNEHGIRKVFEAPASPENKVLRNTILAMPALQIQMPGPGIVSITHELNPFTIPDFSGEPVMGTIFWGDEQQEEFVKGISHTYANSGNHVVTIQTNTYEVTFPSLKGIIKVDLSKF